MVAGSRRTMRRGQLCAGSGEGQSCIRGSGMGVEREEASNQKERLPNMGRLELCAGLAPSPP